MIIRALPKPRYYRFFCARTKRFGGFVLGSCWKLHPYAKRVCISISLSTLEKPSRRVTAPWRTFDSKAVPTSLVCLGWLKFTPKSDWSEKSINWHVNIIYIYIYIDWIVLPRELKFTLALFPTMHFSWLWNLLALRYKSKWLWSAAGPSGTSNLSFIHAFGSVQFSSVQFVSVQFMHLSSITYHPTYPNSHLAHHSSARHPPSVASSESLFSFCIPEAANCSAAVCASVRRSRRASVASLEGRTL